ncbi:radical SAM family heme chaperone HemW [Kriegella aquimaris]|uniref:Heme chaperone HemW n=1 Tax=Kriegella aquimaris TaxID=192904 RepID=A0A1G9U0V8_9FLAO|nr:radical SAM family heme chaperone HemW [Kriegella aquimaris]SDM53609.1 oxygen-independent coproporphyrinogen-3 oxidase [Kriegella aquimaris]
MSGIYIHIPFCKQACHYCDFHFSTTMGKKEAMVLALQTELALRKEEFETEVVETIYFGGGTPSVLDLDEIEAIIATVYQNYKVSENPEITLEANPDDLIFTDSERSSGTNIFSAYRNLGINRLSIGIQSFFEEDLKFMNRAHNAIEAENCLQEATKHFDNISIDLIYGVPGMTNERWERNIEKALSFDLPHISSYALTVEPKTALANFIKKGSVAPLDDEAAQSHYDILTTKLAKAGYVCYEISNFGKPDYFSKNNTAYWQGKKYIGIGPSAHSYDGKNRAWNVRNNAKYMKAIAEGQLPMEIETLSKTDRYNEYIMTGLRTIWGVSLLRVENDFGKNRLEYLLQQARKYLEQDLLHIQDDVLLVTRNGKFLTDGIAADLFMVNLDTETSSA